MLDSHLRRIFINIWPSIFIVMVIAVTLRIAYLMIHKKKYYLYQELLMLLFIIYIITLFHTVTFQDTGSGFNIIPFKEIFRYSFGSHKFIKNIIGNLIIFLPYGFFVSYFLKLKDVKIMVVLCLIVSLAIESTQVFIGRVFDIDDILLNVIGCIIGFYGYTIISKFEDNLPPLLKNKTFYNIIISIITLLLFLYFLMILGDKI